MLNLNAKAAHTIPTREQVCLLARNTPASAAGVYSRLQPATLCLIQRRVGVCLTAIASAVILCIAIGQTSYAGWVSDAQVSEQIQINLVNGSVITVDQPDQTIQWMDVLPDGQMKKHEFPFSEIKQLVLTDSPASKQIAQVRRSLIQLSGPSYQQRESAEAELSKPEVGNRFLPMLKSHLENPSLEFRFRLRRILNRLDDDDSTGINEFDVLTLADGSTRSGDAGQLQLNCRYRDLAMTLSRDDIRMIAPATRPTRPETQSAEVQVKLFQKFKNEFYKPTQTIIDFETAPSGSELTAGTNVTQMFVPQGVIFASDRPGIVGVSRFLFNRFPTVPADNRSVCVIEQVGSLKKSFIGVLEMKFCLPNQPSVAAGVHELGVFIARVNHSRDFILEAYSADGNILGCVEASNEICAFTGIKSTEPIASVRIMSNPYLFRLTRKIDEDYAIDHLCFSPPVPIDATQQATGGATSVQLKNGDLLFGDELKFSRSDVSLKFAGNKQWLPISFDDVAKVQLREQIPVAKTNQRQWMAMLADRSVLKVAPGAQFASQSFSGLKFKPSQVAAVWLAGNRARFPVAGDFDSGDHVMVLPTCRIAASAVEFDTNQYRWGPHKKLQQKLDLNQDEDKQQEEPEDPTPDLTAVNYDETSSEDVPTLWMTPPPSRPAHTGLLVLQDGQQWVLSGSAGFQVTETTATTIKISNQNQTQTIPLSDVVSIEFPDQ